jgi:hypothetical protein
VLVLRATEAGVTAQILVKIVGSDGTRVVLTVEEARVLRDFLVKEMHDASETRDQQGDARAEHSDGDTRRQTAEASRRHRVRHGT